MEKSNLENETITFEVSKGKVKILKKTLGIIALTTGLVLVGANTYCATVNHCHEYCKLSNILGLKHQYNKILKNEFYIPVYYNDGAEDGIARYDSVIEIIDDEEKGPWYVQDGFLYKYEAVGELLEVYNKTHRGPKLVRAFIREGH